MPGTYILPCDRPEFRQCLDRERPFRLLNVDHNGNKIRLEPRRRHQLRYEYTDTGEVVLVPNAPYNLTIDMIAEDVRVQAQLKDEKAAHLKAYPPQGWTLAMVENVRERVLANAQRLRVIADKIQAGLVPWGTPYGLESEEVPSRAWAAEMEARMADAAAAQRLPAASGPQAATQARQRAARP